MTGTGTDVRSRRRTPSAGWWARSIAMVVIPVVIGLLTARHNGAGMAVVVGLMALVGAIFVFHPDTLGWKLSLNGRMVAGVDPGPSHLWQVWARMSGLFLLVVCAAGAILYSPPPPDSNHCVVSQDGALICGPAPETSAQP